MTMYDKIVDIAKLYIGFPYLWGGQSPLNGFDCSGLVVEVLKSVGLISDTADFTAQQFYYIFKHVNAPSKGYLVCYGSSPSNVTHIGICIDEELMIESAPGGSKVDSIKSAIKTDSRVRIRPIMRRIDIVGYVDPLGMFKF